MRRGFLFATQIFIRGHALGKTADTTAVRPPHTPLVHAPRPAIAALLLPHYLDTSMHPLWTSGRHLCTLSEELLALQRQQQQARAAAQGAGAVAGDASAAGAAAAAAPITGRGVDPSQERKRMAQARQVGRVGEGRGVGGHGGRLPLILCVSAAALSEMCVYLFLLQLLLVKWLTAAALGWCCGLTQASSLKWLPSKLPLWASGLAP